MDHRSIITQLGGIRGLAGKLNHPHHTTVQGWFDRNRIPVDRWQEVLGAAEGKFVPADLMPAELRVA